MAKIMVVDDSPSQIANFRRILETRGHEIVTAGTGTEAVQMSRSAQPDLILMDVVMPELNGFQACRIITRHPETASIPIILVTSKDQDTDRVWGQRQGAKGYLVKPPDKDELLAMIDELLAQAGAG